MSILDIKIEGERYMHANDEIISLIFCMRAEWYSE